ncbi:MAG TPA: glycosyltransferase family 1 protein [Candidatus Uhrbacteria bacterium]|nr:glycosyltransferase family 1 protein [Candidatus Uhrbacteria bacterium]
MKILMINKFFYRRGGSEAYMLALIELLKKNSHQVIEFSMQDEKNEPSEYADFFIKNIDFSKREGFIKDLKKAFCLLYSFAAKNKLEALIAQEKPDVAHLHNFNFQLTPSILSVLKKHKIPVVWTMHDYHAICPNYRLFTQGQVCERCKVYRYYNCYKFRCLKNDKAMSFLAMLEMYLHKIILKSYDKIDIFISPSRFLADKVKQWGIKPDKVKHLYNFIDLDNFQPISEHGDGLVYFGRLSEEKGLLTLLEAMKGLGKINLSLIGEGPQKEQILDYIEKNKLNNVYLLGYKKGLELYDLIKKSRLVIMPSIWHENNPISVLEAFALAKPVIASDLGGLPELVENSKTGYLFKAGQADDLKNKIKSVYNDAEACLKLGKNARRKAEKISSGQAHLAEILQIYKNIA